jgi:hypothetical protein
MTSAPRCKPVATGIAFIDIQFARHTRNTFDSGSNYRWPEDAVRCKLFGEPTELPGCDLSSLSLGLTDEGVSSHCSPALSDDDVPDANGLAGSCAEYTF